MIASLPRSPAYWCAILYAGSCGLPASSLGAHSQFFFCSLVLPRALYWFGQFKQLAPCRSVSPLFLVVALLFSLFSRRSFMCWGRFLSAGCFHLKVLRLISCLLVRSAFFLRASQENRTSISHTWFFLSDPVRLHYFWFFLLLF